MVVCVSTITIKGRARVMWLSQRLFFLLFYNLVMIEREYDMTPLSFCIYPLERLNNNLSKIIISYVCQPSQNLAVFS